MYKRQLAELLNITERHMQRYARVAENHPDYLEDMTGKSGKQLSEYQAWCIITLLQTVTSKCGLSMKKIGKELSKEGSKYYVQFSRESYKTSKQNSQSLT